MWATLISLIALATVGVNSISAQQLEFRMISSGGNRPGIPIWNSPMREILAALHADATPNQVATILGLRRAAVVSMIDSMRMEGAVTQADGAPRPSCLVVSADEGASLADLAANAARQAMPFMRRAVQDLKARYREVPGLKALEFDEVSFFLASDVLLDNWQIRAVERLWLKAERPLRGRAQYYCAILARTDNNREPFGIFGNLGFGLTDGRSLDVYGNRRGSRSDLTSLPQSRLAVLAALPDTTGRNALLARVVDQMQQLAGQARGVAPPARFAADLQAIGLMRQEHPVFAVLDTADDRRLTGFAASVADSLVPFLESVTPQLRNAWSSSRWRTETTFEEFGIWWYHFFYTALTEQLASESLIRIPETGLFHYVMLP